MIASGVMQMAKMATTATSMTVRRELRDDDFRFRLARFCRRALMIHTLVVMRITSGIIDLRSPCIVVDVIDLVNLLKGKPILLA